jgi:hypothetical protein
MKMAPPGDKNQQPIIMLLHHKRMRHFTLFTHRIADIVGRDLQFDVCWKNLASQGAIDCPDATHPGSCDAHGKDSFQASP